MVITNIFKCYGPRVRAKKTTPPQTTKYNIAYTCMTTIVITNRYTHAMDKNRIINYIERACTAAGYSLGHNERFSSHIVFEYNTQITLFPVKRT